jgi:hypothetical protein
MRESESKREKSKSNKLENLNSIQFRERVSERARDFKEVQRDASEIGK